MGNKQSSSIKQTTEILNEQVMNLMMNTSNTSNTYSISKNDFEIEIGEMRKGCKLSATQSIDSTQDIKFNSAVKNTADLKNMANQAVDNFAKQQQENKTGFLSAAFNNQSTATDIKTSIKNALSTTITDSTTNTINTILNNANNGKIKIGICDESTVDVAQKIIANQIVSIITDKITDAAMKNETIAKAVNDSENKQKNESTGLDGLVNSIFGGVFSTMAGTAILTSLPLIISCCCCICICLILMMMKK